MTRNRLAEETSPYLLQHKANPVHWQAWGPEALAKARREDKPILLSVGYAACHWCHVMAHESFENDEIAQLMNSLFVNIKVDREERPDLDAIYQAALSLLGQQGGWPLTMFLTPLAEPFWGGTYFPPEDRWGRPGFRQVLTTIAETYRQDPARVEKNVSTLKAALADLAKPRAGSPVAPEVLERIAERLLQEVDPRNGGIGGAPKFPQAPIFELLWRAGTRTGDKRFHEAVYLTLHRMCQGGIYDHLGGGFARYATDAAWLVPHFEKMLYDNAALLELLTLAWQETREPLYEQRIRETVAWLLREMRAAPAPEGPAPLPARSTPTARARKAASMSGAPKRSKKPWARTRPCSYPTMTCGPRAIGKATRSSTAASVRSWPMPRRKRDSRAAAPSSSPCARSACVPAGTTRCWPTGTG